MACGSNVICHKYAPNVFNTKHDGKLIEIFMLLSWTTNMTSLTASEKTIHLASKTDNAMLCCAFDCQDTGTPKTYNTNPPILPLFTGSLL